MEKSEVFIGVTVSSSIPGFAFAALNDEKELLAVGQGNMKDVVAYLAGLSQGCIAISAPQKPAMRKQTQTKKTTKKYLRSVDEIFQQHGIEVEPFGSTSQTCPAWVRHGFTFYDQVLSLGFEPFIDGEHQLRQFFETQADAVFTGLCGMKPYPVETLEGRLQRQLLLYEQDIPVTDPMQFLEEITRFKILHGNLPLEQIYHPAELNALACALTAWQTVHTPENIHPLGTQEEGFVYLPDLPEVIAPKHQMRLPDIYPQTDLEEIVVPGKK
jgi:hypothetical protein